MKMTENSIKNSIQHLKEKLQMDKLQLQNMKTELNRSKSPITRQRDYSNKQNQSLLSNMGKYRNSLQSQKAQQLQLKKQCRKQISQLTANYEQKLRRTTQKHELQIDKLKRHYELIINDKNAYIQCLQSSIPEVQCQPDTPRTSRLNQIQEIKNHYEQMLREVKEKYQSIIQSISEENEELKLNNFQLNNITFKGPGTLMNHARQTLTKYINSQSNSSCAQFSTSHMSYNSNASVFDVRMRESIIDNSERLSSIFGDKFKFKRNDLSKHSSSVSISIDDYSSNRINSRENHSGQNQITPLHIVHEKQIKNLTIDISE